MKTFIDADKIKSIVKQRKNIIHLGLTGGIATGKTTAAEMFKDYGAVIIDFDILARKAAAPSSKVVGDIVNCFGKNILDPNGCLDRKALSQIVFQDQNKRKELEKILHPAIFELFYEQLRDVVENEQKYDKKYYDNRHKNKDHVIVIISVIPLLIEMNLQNLFDKIILVYTLPHIEKTRLMQRENIDNCKAQNMINSQLPIDDKVKYAHFLIDNSEDIENTRIQVKKIWNNLTFSLT